jgi:hypothetical protein
MAILYPTDDFPGTQPAGVRKFINESNSGVEIVFDRAYRPRLRNLRMPIDKIRAAHPMRSCR